MKIKGEDYKVIVDDLNQYIQENGGKEVYFVENYGFLDNSKPFNMGIYYDLKTYKLRADRFIGLIPLAKINKNKVKWDKPINNEVIIEIKSRFGDPIRMLETVLKSEESCDIINILQPRSLSWEEWNKESDFSSKKNPVLYGIFKDIPEIDLKNSDNKKDNAGVLSKIQSIFEVWNYIEKLKVVCDKILKQHSLPFEENLTGKVKGKINIQKQIRYNLSCGRIDRNYCIYNKMTIDNKENRILKYVLYLCMQWSNEAGGLFSEDIAYCNRVLLSVKLKKFSNVDLVGIKSNGAFRQYKVAFEAGQRIMNRISVSFDAVSNNNKINITNKIKPFFIRMDLLFELYCRALLGDIFSADQKYKKYKIKSYNQSEIKIFDTKNEYPNGFQNNNIPDIVIMDGNKNIAVIDAKYMPLDEKEQWQFRGNTHQILAYMLILNVNYGGFIYPKVNELNNKENVDCKLVNMNTPNKFGFSIPISFEDNKDIDNIKQLIKEIIDDYEKKGKVKNGK